MTHCDCDWSPLMTDMPHRAWCFSVTGVQAEPGEATETRSWRRLARNLAGIVRAWAWRAVTW